MELTWLDAVSGGTALQLPAQEPGETEPASLNPVISEFFVKESFVTGYCAAIILFLCVHIVWLQRGARTLRRNLRKLRTTLTPPEDRSFPEHFDGEYNATARNLLGVPWTEFVETLPDRGPGQPVQNVVDANLYLNRETVIDARIRTRWFKTVPNLLTGLGILGTFIGLAAGVRLAGIGLTSGSPESINDALQRLLDGASLAFWTSIAGISSSIVFLIIERLTSQGSRRLSGNG